MKRTAYLACAFHPDAPVVQFYDSFGDGQPQPKTIVMPCKRIADLIKPVEDMGLLFIRHSQALVLDTGDNASDL